MKLSHSFNLNFINAKRNVKFMIFEKTIFSFFIISLVIFDFQETTIPQIKAENISFGPYAFTFLATSNIFRARK